MIFPAPQEIVDMDAQEQEALLRRAEEAGVSVEDLSRFRAVFASYDYVSSLIASKQISMARLRGLLFGSRSEKWRDLQRQQERRATGAGRRRRIGAGRGAGISTGAHQRRVERSECERGARRRDLLRDTGPAAEATGAWAPRRG